MKRALDGEGAGPLADKLKRLCFSHLNSGVDLLRPERLARGLGLTWLAPAHFASCIPYAYLPPPPDPAWSDERARVPGKPLLQRVMTGTLPDEVLERPKYWPHPVGSRGWRERALERMARASAVSIEALAPLFSGRWAACAAYHPEAAIALAFWHRLFFARRAGGEAPTWEELEA